MYQYVQRRSSPFRNGWLGVLAILWLAPTTTPAADDYDRAHDYLLEDSYEEALPLLEQAYGEQPAAGVTVDLGLTYYHLGRFQQALPLIEHALASQPSDPRLRPALIRILIALGRPSEALPHLQHLDGMSKPEQGLLAGDLHSTLGDTRAAIAAYESGLSGASPRLLQRLALRLIPLYRRSDRDRAAQELGGQALAAAPDSFDADSLRLLLAVERPSPHDFAAHLHYRFENDDNVRLQPDDVDLGQGDQGDTRQTLMADLLGRYGLGGAWDLFGEAHLYRSFHSDLSEFDQTDQVYVASLGWSGDGWGWRLPLEYGRSDLDGELYRSDWALRPGVYMRWGGQALVHGFLRWQSDDYDDDLALRPAENRDGTRVGGGLLGLWSLAEGRGDLRLMLERYRDDADGANWDRDLTRLYTRAKYRPYPRIEVGLSYQFDRYDYDHLNDLFLATREDRVHSLSAWLGWEFARHWEARLQGSHVDWNSNLDAYSYTRTVISAGVSWTY